MNRADLSWALNAVIPHAGSAAQGLNFINLETAPNGALFVYATDRYTAGIARVEEGPTAIEATLTVKDATELMRFVRPSRVPEREQYVFFEQHGEFREELHVGFDDLEESGAWENGVVSEVYEVAGAPEPELEFLLAYLRRLNDEAPIEDDLILQPKLVEKFAKAARETTDRLWILPRTIDERHGGAIVACGQNFIGAISGLTYDELGEATVASFLTEHREAA